MTDWHRMEWQFRANKIATAILIALVLTQVPEVLYAIKYHFPWWDDVAEAITLPAALIARFVQKHTEMYRIDR